MTKGSTFYNKAKTLIPGGTQLLSKRPEMFLPDFWPSYYSRATGARVWDLDNQEYIDMSYMGIGCAILGYCDPDVDQAVHHSVNSGNLCTLNTPQEVELAELLLDIHPWADMTRYARSGGEAMTVAVRIARASTGRDILLFCGYHGWHDWYLAANLGTSDVLGGHLLEGLNPRGVPKALAGTVFPFHYNDIEAFNALVEQHHGRIAAIIMEPVRSCEPVDDFLQVVQRSSEKEGAVFIMDEVTSGWRIVAGGAHLHYGITPDIAVFAKGISNGYPMAAILGRRSVMDAVQDTFISSTYWTDRIGPSAAIATIKKIIRENVPEKLIHCGQRVKNLWKSAAGEANLDISISGIDPLGHFEFSDDDSLAAKTLLTQLLLDDGFLGTTSFYACFQHTDEMIDRFGESLHRAFNTIRKAKEGEGIRSLLRGDVCHSGFTRLT